MQAALLVLTAFVTATLSGVLGMGGGILLLGVMGNFLPPTVLIPIHGLVQLGSNASRAWLSRESIDWKVTRLFAAGSVLGALVGSQVVVTLPERTMTLLLAGFILFMTWMPQFQAKVMIPGKFFLLGLGSTFLSLFIGATGPLQAPFFLRERLTKEGIIATKAATQVIQHFTKVSAFFALGFAIGPYLPLVAGMLLAVVAGSYCGKFLLNRVSEAAFIWTFKIVITLLAVRMLMTLPA